MWGLKREEHTYWKILHVFDMEDGVVDQNDYEVMRDVLITDILLCNGQRPGIVSALVVSDFGDAEQEITKKGYNRLMVPRHRTGYLQAAMILTQSDTFVLLRTFALNILLKLPCYNSNARMILERDSFVFQMYRILSKSSQISPIIRKVLYRQGVCLVVLLRI